MLRHSALLAFAGHALVAFGMRRTGAIARGRRSGALNSGEKMKCLILLILLAVPASCPAIADSSCSADEKALHDAVNHQYQTGSTATSRVVVGEAQLNYLQAQLACEEISRSNFCKQAIDLARENIRVSTNQMMAGVDSAVEIIHLQREYRKLKAYCK
jgi:hypothetical protein